MALLSASWLLGVGVYGPADVHAWIALVALGTMLLLWASAYSGLTFKVPLSVRERAGVRGTRGKEGVPNSEPAATSPHPNPLPEGEGDLARVPLGAALAAAALLLPAIYAAAWPDRAGPLLLAAGLFLVALARGGRWRTAIGIGAIASGVVLIVQGAALALYIAGTARSHDAPWPIPQCLAAMMGLFGAEASVHGPYLVVQSMRQTHRLAATWDLAVDPAALLFLVGGLTLLAAAAWRRFPPGRRGGAWRKAAVRLTAIVVCWLPLRAAILIAVYLHRVERFPSDWPLHAMNHFFSPWIGLLLLAPPALLAWRLARLPTDPRPRTLRRGRGGGGRRRRTGRAPGGGPPRRRLHWRCSRPPLSPRRRIGTPSARAWQAASSVSIAIRPGPPSPALATRKCTASRGATNYRAAYRWLAQYYDMSHLLEADKIDDATLAECDVLVIKIPTARYTRDEADAVVRFVEQGGGLLLIGDHTNMDRSAAYMNDMTRSFGFIFRDDLLFGTAGSPYDDHYAAAATPHPAVQHVPWFDFAVSCSIEPGWSWGRAAILATGLWNMPPDYHRENYHPVPQHCPEMRCGAFIQAWATRCGKAARSPSPIRPSSPTSASFSRARSI